MYMNSDDIIFETHEGIKLQTAENFNEFAYLKHLYELEKNLQILKERRDEIGNELLKLKPIAYEKSKMYRESKKLQKIYIKKEYPKKTEKNWEKFSDIAATIISFAFLGGGAFCIVLLFFLHGDFGGRLLHAFKIYVSILLSVGAIDIILLIIGRITDKKEYEATKKRIDLQNLEIEKKNAEIKKQNKEKINRCEKEYTEYKDKAKIKENIITPILLNEYKTIQQKQCEIGLTLEKLYNLKINGVWCLHPNYRGLTTIAILYSYFETGRCTQLQGHEGAYNIYEDERLKGIIISKVDEISCKMDNLNATMSYVGRVMDEVNDRVRELSSESSKISDEIFNLTENVNRTGEEINTIVSHKLGSIEEHVANSAYYSEIDAKVSTFNAVYNLLS